MDPNGTSPHEDAQAVLSSLAQMVARSSAAGTLPDGFVDDLIAADPTAGRLSQVLELATRARVRFGAGFLREAGHVLFSPQAPTPYDAGLAWLRAAGADPTLALDVLDDRVLATLLVTTPPGSRAAGRERSRLLRAAASGERGGRARSMELATWARGLLAGPDGPSAAGPVDGLVALALRDVLFLDEVAADPHHPDRAAVSRLLGRAQGDQLVLSGTADSCVRFNRLRLQGAAPAERPAAVAESCRLLDFALRPLLGDPRRGEPGETYLRIACDLTAMTALWALVRDGGGLRPDALVARWPGAAAGSPARVAELDRGLFRELLDLAASTPGIAADLVRASRSAPEPA